jgi:Asp-tRNA(Asn)/Glu-tRNA(Gln) amidotransferase A subunit family amidase
MTAFDALAAMRSGRLSAETLVRACLDRVAARDGDVRAWSAIDRDHAIAQARLCDAGPWRGPLHGLPIGVKDVIDTAEFVTAHNSPIYSGRRPSDDAPCVAMLRNAGAIILGKTDTTECAAAGRDAGTLNPWARDRTPGGSSSGSAAAVADFQVPIALGTQTGGSTIRPASFCGVFAMKPSWGLVSREGVKLYAISLDTIGWYGRSVADLELLCDLFEIDQGDIPDAGPDPRLRVAICRTPAWHCAAPETESAMAAATAALSASGVAVDELVLPDHFAGLAKAHQVILFREGRAAFLNLARIHPAILHDDFHRRVDNRDGFSLEDLRSAYDLAARCRWEFDKLAAHYDAVLAPSAPGEAPPGSGPGDPVFNAMWTLLHTPCINIPAFTGPTGLPVGVTLTAGRFDDRRLLRAAGSIANTLIAAGHWLPTPAIAQRCD